MHAHAATRSNEIAQAVAELVAGLPLDRAAQVYDFARFLQAQPLSAAGVTNDLPWLDDSEAQMQAEDEIWEATYTRHRDRFRALKEAALDEINADATHPMFDESGEFAVR